ncbi:TPA: MFS transporter [Enterococcus faecium]|uniref:Major facilitator superfamily transporter n=13 Tax=Bacteria TaxID=2 RepID=A0ABD7LTE8_ENTFC|nr:MULTISPECIES: MFS transporter [Enterococcus]ALZ53846.1 MFS transporter [Enterococcus faecium]AOM14893.1 MFS transporter [Enterococcus faecium]AQT58415.1 Bacillibactin exporter [Enterococcus faecium]AQY30417.1 MFS transporter [Enterococcus faecium]ATD79827.1 MFS transporter [Enterococcus faecium]
MNNQKSLLQKGAILSISLMLTSSQAINGVIPQMKQSLGISQSQSELLGTAPSITVILFILLSSYFAKRIGMKKTIILGLLLAGIGGIIPVFTATFQTVLISRVILGAGLGVYNSLAVTYISSLYSGNTRATLLGIRNSMEALGQTILIFLAGVLVNINWTASFLVYAIAFPVALLFALKVPEIRDENSDIPENHVKEKMNPMVFALVLFAILLVMNSIAISVRFASIATEIKGVNFNASNYLALMPILGILAGFMFGPINKWIGKGTLYLGIIFFIISNLLIAVSNGNMTFLLTGLFLSSITGSWCFPFIFSNLDKVTTKNTINFATSLIFIGCNIGNFIAPIAMQLAQFLTRSTNLTAPFFVFAGIFIVILFVTFFATNKKNTRVTRGAS